MEFLRTELPMKRRKHQNRRVNGGPTRAMYMYLVVGRDVVASVRNYNAAHGGPKLENEEKSLEEAIERCQELFEAELLLPVDGDTHFYPSSHVYTYAPPQQPQTP